MQCTVGAHRVYVHSVSWIRHLGMACGEMFVVHCSHNLPATAELPFANRPGDRTDRFRSTCRSSLLVRLTIYCLLRWCCCGPSIEQIRIFVLVYLLIGMYKLAQCLHNCFSASNYNKWVLSVHLCEAKYCVPKSVKKAKSLLRAFAFI